MVKIYIFELTQSVSDKEISFLLTQLNNSEIKMLPKQKGRNFEFSVIGKILVKKIISNETATLIHNIVIGKTKLGKPIIKKPNDLNLDISISHSGNFLVVGICDSGNIGVDIELLKNIDFQIFRNCLSVSEEKYINSAKEITQKLENFYEIWTRKEAYLKALGIGLQKPLPITQFYPDPIKPTAEITHGNRKYNLSTLKEDKFILSVCTTRSTTYEHRYKKLTIDKLLSFVTNLKDTHYNFDKQSVS